MNLRDVMVRNRRVLSQRSEGVLILLDPDSGEYFSLDDVGGRIWELCDGMRTANDLVTVLEREYETPAGGIQSDVLEILRELSQAGLVTPSDSSG